METFPYQLYESEPTIADASKFYWRPMLPVRIFGLSASMDTIALVDTGAAETLIPLDYWDRVEPASRPGEEGTLLAANGTEILLKYGSIDLAIQIGNEVYRWGVKVGFSDGRDEMVLGDWGFLRHFAVRFDRHAGEMTVYDPPDLPPSFVAQIPTGNLPQLNPGFRNRASKGRNRRRHPRP